MSGERFDAIVIGAGHNGLTAAAVLARRGKSVCVVEKNQTTGGMATNAEIVPGVQAPRIAHLLYNLSPRVSRAIGLQKSPAGFATKPLATVSLSPDQRHVITQAGRATFADGSPHPEADAYATLHARLTRYAALLGRMSDRAPPTLQGGLSSLAALGEIGALARLGLGLKRLGKADMREFLRVVLSNAHDAILDELSDGPLAGGLAADAVRGAFNGPRAPGTVFTLMYRLGRGGDAQLPVGGMGAVAAAFEAAAHKAGCEIRTRSGVARVLVEKDAVSGVELEDGTVLSAPLVLTSTGALAAMRLTGPEHFDAEAVRRLRAVRAKGSAAKVNLVLSAAPCFDGLSAAQTAGRLLVAPSSEYVERAFNPAKYGQMSDAPVIEAVIPTLTDPGIASDGRHVLSAVVQYAPYALEGGWTDAARHQLTRRAIATLERFTPGLGALVSHADTLSPVDIEALTGAPGGHWHHAEMALDQLLTLRPANGIGRYALGPGGYYLCGASAHPGGDVMGAAGRNAALRALADRRAT